MRKKNWHPYKELLEKTIYPWGLKEVSDLAFPEDYYIQESFKESSQNAVKIIIGLSVIIQIDQFKQLYIIREIQTDICCSFFL